MSLVSETAGLLLNFLVVFQANQGVTLRSRLNGHRSAIKKGCQSLLHKHFCQPVRSVDDMRVQILEKVCHSS